MEDENEVQDAPPDTEQPEAKEPEAPQNDGASSISERELAEGESLVEDTEAVQETAERLSNLSESEKDELRELIDETTACLEPVAESTDEPSAVVTLTERAEMRREGKVWQVTVLCEGWSLNNRYYPIECLREAQKIWERARVCAYGWDPTGRQSRLDHVPAHIERAFPEGTFLNEVGFLRNVNLVTEGGKGRLVAEFCVTNKAIREALLEIEEMGGDLPGFSIHGEGETRRGIAEGKEGLIVTRITKRKELTIVSEPAAGGRFERLVASLQNREEKKKMEHTKLRQFLAEHLPKSLRESVQKMDAPSLLEAVYDVLKEMDGSGTLLKMALKWLKAGKTEEAAEILETVIAEMDGAAPAEDPVEEMKDEEDMYEAKATAAAKEQLAVVESLTNKVNGLSNQLALRQCSDLLEAKLTEAHLPDVGEAQIRESFANRVFEASELEKRIKQTKDLLAVNAGGEALIESGHAVPRQFGGDPRISILYEGQDKLSMAADLLFRYDYEKAFKLGEITESQRQEYKALNSPRVYSPLSLYHAATNDYEHRNRICEGAILESATTSNFSNILGTSMTKSIAIIFKTQQAPAWDDLIVQRDLPTLKQQDRHVVGGFTQLPTVAEAAAYTDLGVPLELPTNYSLSKKGGYFRFTEEMVLADDMGFFQEIIPALVRAGVHTRDTIAYSFISDNTLTSYDGVVQYHANHHNTGTTALSQAATIVAENAIRNHLAPAQRTTLGAAITDEDEETIVFASTEGMQDGDYIRIEAEFVRVISVTNSTTAECTRGVLGSTNVTHLISTPAWIMGGGLTQSDLELTLVVPTELAHTARVIANSDLLPGGTNNDVNTMKGLFKVLPVNKIYLGGDANNWYLMASHRVFPAIEFGYFDGRRSPEIVTQDNPAVGTVFTNDQMTYRAKFRMGGKAIFHEGRYGSIVSG